MSSRLLFKNRSVVPRWVIFITDVMICSVSLFAAYQLRFNFNVPSSELINLGWGICILLIVRISTFVLFRINAGMIQYTSSEDAQRIFITVSLGSLAIGLLNFIAALFYGKYLLPFSILIIDYLITMFLLTAFRLGVKIIYMELEQSGKSKVNVIIYGAGDAGIMTKRTLENDPKKNYKVIAFVDHRSQLSKQKIEGVLIYDLKNDFENLLVEKEVEMCVMAVWEIPPSRKKQIVDSCLKHNVRVLHTPPMNKWLNGELSFSQIKEIKIEDLLEREAIELDREAIKQQVNGKRILITGAAGSIGSELVRQVLLFNPGQLVLVDQAESPLYEVELELKNDFPLKSFEIVIGDVRNEVRMRNVFNTFKPQLVFHAAAYKHVPMMEHNPAEAVMANIAGTKTVADLAVDFGVEKFVLVSTDKAVNPTNVMGASKRVAEIYVQSLGNKNETTRFVTTRFGNVLGSNGSVIPLFRKQIENGGPVTVTDPEVTRFFMTIPEACQLVLEAGAMGKGGEIFIFDMGEPVKIVDLAKKMIQLSGLEPDRDIKIQFSGLRPGEKLYEELLATSENTQPTHHPKIMIAKVRVYDFDLISTEVNKIVNLYLTQNNDSIVQLIKNMVPEYISNNSVFEKLDK